jgi:peptidoglycan/xylan/chitin deacetylase (PgdA/CDA1 family)
MKVAALLYHDVVEKGRLDDSGFPGPGPGRYKLDLDDFEHHLETLARRVGTAPAAVDDLRRGNSATAWLLTFDDGGSSASRIGELLAARKWRGHFFVTVDYIGTPPFLDESAIRALRDLGHVVGSHSCSHPERMSRCTWDELVYEWTRSTEVLSELLGEAVDVASVPAGHYARVVAKAAAASGIRTLFTSEPVLTVRDVEGCRVLGRYTIQRGVPAERAAALANRQPAPRARQFAFWNAKKAAKKVGGERYLRLRERLLAG